MGNGEFTDKLYHWGCDLRQQGALGARSFSRIEFQINGPFGKPFDYRGYGNIILIAGGIGITPCHSIFETMIDIALNMKNFNQHENDNYKDNNSNDFKREEEFEIPNVNLIWIVRDKEMFDIFKDTWKKFKRFRLIKDKFEFNIGLYLYYTRATELEKKQQEIERNGIIYYARKPDVSDIIRFSIDSRDNRKSLVYCCGPKRLAHEAQLAATECGAHYHGESFDFSMQNDGKVFACTCLILIMFTLILGCLMGAIFV